MSKEIQRYLLATETTSEGYGMGERDVTRATLHPSNHGNVVLYKDHKRALVPSTLLSDLEALAAEWEAHRTEQGRLTSERSRTKYNLLNEHINALRAAIQKHQNP